MRLDGLGVFGGELAALLEDAGGALELAGAGHRQGERW